MMVLTAQSQEHLVSQPHLTQAGIITNPIDVIKTRQMVSRAETGLSIWGTARELTKEEGIRGFFKAVHVRALYIGFGSTLFFIVYEQLKKYIKKQYFTY